MAEMEWVCITSKLADTLASPKESQTSNNALSALQIKVTALLVEWGWVPTTAVDMERLMAWADTVSKDSVLLHVLGKML